MGKTKDRKTSRGLLRKIGDISMLVIFIGITLVIFAFLVRALVFSRFLPGTIVGGVDMSRETTMIAKYLLNQSAEKYLNTPVEIKIDNQTQNITPKELGVDVLTAKTIDNAYEENNKNTAFYKYLTPTKEIIKIPAIVQIDEVKLIEKLAEKFSTDSFKPKNAYYTFDNRGKLQIMDETAGLQIDEKGLKEDLKVSAENLTSTNITVKLKPATPAVTRISLEEQKPNILGSLRQTTILTHPSYKNKWHLLLVEHLDWVTFIPKQQIIIGETVVPNILPKISVKTTMLIQLDKQKLKEFIDEKISPYLDDPVGNVNIYKDKDGKIIIDGKGEDGSKIQRDIFEKDLETAINNRAEKVTVPALELTPTVTVSEELKALGIKERISVGHTSFYGSPLNRIHNIEIGSSQFNGVLIAPDETFSANKALGVVDGRHGYLMELVIKPEGTIPEFGGGLCQVSTTLYRAALFAGLPITKRQPHSYAVTYYSQILGPGLDATIYSGSVDLQFKNDTGSHLLLQAYVKNKHELYMIFYGTADGRKVEMEGPYISNGKAQGETIYEPVADLPAGKQKQVEIGHRGFDTLWYRYITSADGKVTKEEIKSSYKNIPAKIEIGTGGTTVPPASSTPPPATSR